MKPNASNLNKGIRGKRNIKLAKPQYMSIPISNIVNIITNDSQIIQNTKGKQKAIKPKSEKTIKVIRG